MGSSDSSMDENERRFLQRATMLSRPSIPVQQESPPSPSQRTPKIYAPSNPQERNINATKNNNNTTPSKPSTSRKRAREHQEKEAASEPSSEKNKKDSKLEDTENAAAEKKKASKSKDKENAPREVKESGGGKKRKVNAVREEEEKGIKLQDKEKAAPNNEKEKKTAPRLRKRKEKSAPNENIRGSEEKREKGGSEEKRKEMVDSEKKAECDCDCNPENEVAKGSVDGGTSVSELKKQLVKESTDLMNNIRNEIENDLRAESRKLYDQLKECIRNMGREAKHASSNNRTCDDFRFSSNEMVQRASVFKSKEFLPLSSSEMEEFERKWRQQEAIELEATIKRLVLMQEELQLKVAKIRACSSDATS